MFAFALPRDAETGQTAGTAADRLARLARCDGEILIATDRGELPLSGLCPGDRVLTRDNGLQPIRRIVWTGARDIETVVIRKGGLGCGMPLRDTCVSAQHRILVTGEIAALLLDESEALIAARHLVGLAGVAPAQAQRLCHMEFDHDEVILSNGCWTECFSTADKARGATASAQARELAAATSDRDDVLG